MGLSDRERDELRRLASQDARAFDALEARLRALRDVEQTNAEVPVDAIWAAVLTRVAAGPPADAAQDEADPPAAPGGR